MEKPPLRVNKRFPVLGRKIRTSGKIRKSGRSSLKADGDHNGPTPKLAAKG
jgi:hypothetical protein